MRYFCSAAWFNSIRRDGSVSFQVSATLAFDKFRLGTSIIKMAQINSSQVKTKSEDRNSNPSVKAYTTLTAPF